MRILNIDSRIYLLVVYKHSIKTRRRSSKPVCMCSFNKPLVLLQSIPPNLPARRR